MPYKRIHLSPVHSSTDLLHCDGVLINGHYQLLNQDKIKCEKYPTMCFIYT